MRSRLSVRGFYRAALLLPLIVPALFWLTPTLGVVDPDTLIHLPIAASLPIAGVAYACFAVLMATWMRARDTASIRAAILKAPLLFALFFAAWSLARTLLRGAAIDRGFGETLIVFEAFVLLLGYLYVGFAEALRWLGTRAGHVENPN